MFRTIVAAALAALLAGSAAAATLDQDNLTGASNGARIGGTSTTATTGSAQAQTFTAGLTGVFHSAVLRLATFTETTTDVSVALWSVDGLGAPGAMLGSAVTAPTSTGTAGAITDWVFDFLGQGLAMTAGQQYALVATHGTGFGTSWRADVSNPYSAAASGLAPTPI